MYRFKYYIANESSSASGDYPCNYDKIQYIFDQMESSRQAEKMIKDVLRDGMESIIKPTGIQELECLVNDIVTYYEKHFMMSSSEAGKEVKIELFLKMKPHKYADSIPISDPAEVRIFCRKIPGAMAKRSWETQGNIGEKIEKGAKKYGGKEIWFQDTLRYFLAHELFHVFHYDHYANEIHSKAAKERFYGYEMCAESILKEVFAEYFAVVYMRQYLDLHHRPDKWIFLLTNDGKANRCFGIGRKKLAGNYFGPSEIEADRQRFSDLKENDDIKMQANNDGLSDADYAGGYMLWVWGDKKGVQGKQLKAYYDAYNMLMSDRAEDALRDLILLKEQMWPY